MCLDGISRKLETVDSAGIPPSPMHMSRKPPDLRWWISPIHIGARKIIGSSQTWKWPDKCSDLLFNIPSSRYGFHRQTSA